ACKALTPLPRPARLNNARIWRAISDSVPHAKLMWTATNTTGSQHFAIDLPGFDNNVNVVSRITAKYAPIPIASAAPNQSDTKLNAAHTAIVRKNANGATAGALSERGCFAARRTRPRP